MFTQPWFWLVFFAFFFNTLNGVNIQKGIAAPYSGSIGAVSYFALLLFLIIGLFCADAWWHPLCALAISFLGGGLVSAIIPEKISVIFGMIGAIISIILTTTAYIVWY